MSLGTEPFRSVDILEPSDRITLRFDGARDWADEAFVRSYIEEPVDVR